VVRDQVKSPCFVLLKTGSLTYSNYPATTVVRVVPIFSSGQLNSDWQLALYVKHVFWDRSKMRKSVMKPHAPCERHQSTSLGTTRQVPVVVPKTAVVRTAACMRRQKRAAQFAQCIACTALRL
jgi:hypothetical protein